MNMDGNTPVISSSLSAKVLFPWSMCAIMQKFLILSTGNLERSMDSFKKKKKQQQQTNKCAELHFFQSHGNSFNQIHCSQILLCALHYVLI